MERYDLCVIGGGPSGYAAAMRAIDFGKKVLLIEKDKIGGAGLYNGALWSKTMWEYSQKIMQIRQETGKNHASFEGMMKMTDEALFDRKFQMTVHMKLLHEETESKLFNYEKGKASFIDQHKIQIQKKNEERIVYAEHVVIATGSRPRKVDNIPVDEKIIVTSDGIGNFNKLPESLVVVGAGVIGCEFATIFSNLGKTKVFLIDKGDRILPFEDEDVAFTVMGNLEKNGVVIHKKSSLNKIEIIGGRVHYELKYNNGTLESFNVEHALISIGRVPNVEELNLSAAGVELTASGYVKETDTLTTAPNIYVAGDLSANMALVNVGEREGRHAVARIYGNHVKPLVYTNISTIMFLNPEVASVGMGEQDAIDKCISVKVAKIDYSCIARAIAMRKTNGFFKIIVSNDAEMKLLGMRAVGEHASSAIQAVAYLIHTNQGIEELAVMMHPHPSIIEGIQECVRMLLGKSIYKSSVFKDKLKCYVRQQDVCIPLERL
jgi:dihydrolipoamide dehydrogenase